LKPLENEGLIDCWVDTRIAAGKQWNDEIQRALDAARIAVLLISADFFASDFIRLEELPKLLEAAASRRLTLLAVISNPISLRQHKSLSAIQSVNPPDKPVAMLSDAEQETVWAKLSGDIERALQELAGVAPAIAAKSAAEDWSDLPHSELTRRQYDELVGRLASRSAITDPELMLHVAAACDYTRGSGGLVLKEGQASRSAMEETVGLRLNRGHWSPHLVLDAATHETVLENALVFVWNYELTPALVELLAEVADRANRPLLIVAKDVEEEALAQLIRVTQAGTPCVAIQSPGWG
jgi:hypothetical protein